MVVCGNYQRLDFHLSVQDLKLSNLLFRTADENSDIMIADFGLSRVVEDNTLIDIAGRSRPSPIQQTPLFLLPVNLTLFRHLLFRNLRYTWCECHLRLFPVLL